MPEHIYFSGGGGSITADNGLTANTSTNARLGGTLLQNTVIDATDDYYLSVVGSVNAIPFRVTANSIASQFTSAVGIGVQATAGDSFPAGHFTNSTGYVDSIIDAVHVQHEANGGAAALGIGVGISMNVSNDTGLFQTNRLMSEWLDLTHASRTSRFTLSGLGVGVSQNLLLVDGTGLFTLVQGLQDFADDEAASVGGIEINQLYRNGSVVMIRVE